MDEKKFNTLLLRHDFAAAKRLLQEGNFTEEQQQVLSRRLAERKQQFWRNFWEDDLYAGIPAAVMLIHPLLWALCVLTRRIPGLCVLSAAVSAGMLWFYRKTIRPLWKRLKRPGGMAVFERDKKRLGWLLWQLGLAWSLLFTGLLLYMLKVPPWAW